MVWASFASLGIVLGAAYLLWLYQRVFWGPLDNPENQKVKDLNRRELALGVALVACMVWIGVYPKPIFDLLDKPVEYVVRKVDPNYYELQQMPVAPTAVTRNAAPASTGTDRLKPLLHAAVLQAEGSK
jgi:NADH-quinone oxidoreductase subunit M